jgi:putative transcriptional regulator
MQLASGVLLVATPALQDPNFADTVVLLLDVSDEGALGVVLNRPSQVLVSDVLEPWGDVVAEPEVLFQGGPVGTDGALAVARLHDPSGARSAWSTSTRRPSSWTAR